MAKRALLVGCNYRGTPNELRGCIDDVRDVAQLLRQRGYTEMVVLTDDSIAPTKANILAGIAWLLSAEEAHIFEGPKTYRGSAGRGAKLFFHYSGHGSTVPCHKGEEVTGRDSVICPLDFQHSGFILDDELKAKLADKIPSGARLLALSDSCFSGTVFDLCANLMEDEEGNCDLDINHHESETKGEVILLSGCEDTQTSADCVIDGRPNGALTAAFLNVMHRHNCQVTCDVLLREVRQYIRSRALSTQIPCLSFGRRESAETDFSL